MGYVASVFVHASIESHEDRSMVLLDATLVPKAGTPEDDAAAVVVQRPSPTFSPTSPLVRLSGPASCSWGGNGDLD